MKLKKILEAVKAPEGKGIIVFDIDDTVVKARGLRIYRKKGEKKVALTPEDFAKENPKEMTGKGWEYDFSDFQNYGKLFNSIITGTPIISNLRMLDAHLNAGWDLAFLTARGFEQANKNAIKKWLKVRDKITGKLKPIEPSQIKYFIAVNDISRQKEIKSMKDSGDYDSKALFLKMLKKKYDQVKFVDDDEKNLKKARQVLEPKNVIKANIS